MIPRLICLLLCWDFAAHLGRAQKLPGVKKASLKVQINATSDTVVLKFLRPTPNINLEGFILGYGSSFFSTQYIPLPENGNSYDTELDAEPRYLVAVRPSPIVNGKKPCSAQNKVQKPLQVVVGTLTPTSVYLAWGVLVNPQNDWTVLNKCPTDRFYTVRYREKEKSKKWNFQLCPSTEAVVDNLKPNIIYEFGVKDNSEDGTWNKGVTHQTTVPPKHKNGGNGHIQNTYPKGHIQVASEDTKMLVPVTVIKHVVQNISNGKKPKSTVSSALPTSTTPSSVDQETTGPIISNALQLLGTTLAVNIAHPLPVILATSEAPETAKATAGNQMTQVPQVSPITKRYISTEHPESTLVSNELPLFIPTVGTTQRTGKQFTDPATHQITERPLTANEIVSTDKTLASHEITQEPQDPQTNKVSSPTEKADSILVTHPIPEESLGTIKIVSTEIPAAKLQVTNEPSTVNVFISTDEHDSNLEEHYITQEPHKTKLYIPTEHPDESLVMRQPIQDNRTTRIFVSTKQPDATLANLQTVQESHTIKAFISTDQPDSISGIDYTAHHTTQESSTMKISISAAQPDTTTEKHDVVSESPTMKTFIATDRPDSKPAAHHTTKESSTMKISISAVQPDATTAAHHTTKESSTMKISISAVQPDTTTEVRQMTQEPPTDILDISPAQPDSTPVSNEPNVLASREDTAAVSDIHQSKPVPNEIHELPSAKPKADQTTQKALPTPAQKKTQRAPISLIHLHIFGDPDTTPVPNETSKAKTVHPTERPQTKNVPKSTHRVPINLIRLQIFEDPSVTLAPSETQKASSKPISQTTELPHVKADFEEVHTEPTKPKIFTPRPRPQTTQAPRKFNPSSSRPKTSARPRTRPVPNRKTQATALPNSSNDLNWISETAVGAKLTGQDVTKLLGVSRNTSTELNGTVKRPISGSSLPPPRPTHMRRRPFPSNNVTGRPGIAGNGLMPRSRTSSSRHVIRPTQVAEIERTPSPKLRTTSAPEKETVTEPVFNASPLEDYDPLGKQRFTAPHVKYIRKEDLVPCSITETMRHFPTEMATNEEEATIAPQNPPSNLTVVAVEGCPSFVILDWKPPENDTVKEYTVISTENGEPTGKNKSILTTNQTHSTVENLKPDTSYEFKVIATNIIGEGPPSTTVTHNTESADPRVSEPITGGKDAIWTEIKFKSDTYSECKGKQYVKRTWYKKFVGIQLCNSLRYKIYLSDSLSGKFYNIGDESGYGEDHCQFVDSFLDGRTGQQLYPDQLPNREGFYRSVRQQPVEFGKIGSQTHIRYVHWYECGTTIPGKW